ncbi:hypothetical protein M878_30540 [Streptomyces roseochromogenus subsp. oscitans DS 12.976]|uniref:Uncharacterized protein n=1 Tax=Streptomyces roseochromogenus subsp. oscitans DS 12.976 TaxID=1352936 RepID=V6JXF4_STRRC|nr:hypothetical protein M878_30540 [Streptomyces roseochromogenus subsp. oscitans DS 12.976]
MPRADIVAMLGEGLSNTAIARALGCDRHRVADIRRELELPNVVQQPLTREQKWRSLTRPLEDGHLEWLGERVGAAGTPVMRYKDRSFSPAGIAFTLQHGRQPQGRVQPECGVRHCVAPEHVDDEPGRQQTRRERRARQGLGDAPATCVHGHDQTEHGRFDLNGTAYCEACKREWRRNPAAMKARTATTREDQRRTIEKLLREDTPHVQIARQLGVAPATVQRVRADLDLPPARSGRPDTHASLEEAFHANTELVEGGHLRWTGYTSSGSPYVCYRQERITAGRVAFALHHGRTPDGRVQAGCSMPGCVAGAHLEDRRIREADRRADAAFDAIFGPAADPTTPTP